MIALHWSMAWFLLCIFTTVGFIAGGVLASAKEESER
jgi:hypothetical protein